MNTCARNTAACDQLDVRLVKLYLRPTVRPICAGCRGAMDALGMAYTVVEPDRRPAWLAHLTPKDMTGARVA